MVQNSRQARGKDVITRIVNYFAKHPNQTVTVKMLSSSLRVSEERIRSSINSFRWYHRAEPDHVSKKIETEIRGHAWRYVVPGLPVPDEAPEPALAAPAPQDIVAAVESTVDAPVPEADTVAALEKTVTLTKRVFEEVGPVAGGFVIQDEDGALYRAVRL